MFLGEYFKWIVPLRKPVEESKLHTLCDDTSVTSFFSANSDIVSHKYESEPTSLTDVSTYADNRSTDKSTISADRLTSLLSLASDSDSGKALENSAIASESGDGITISGLSSESELFDPNPSDGLRKKDLLGKDSSCSPLKSSADCEDNYPLPIAGGDDGTGAKNELIVKTNAPSMFEGGQNPAASPLISLADSIETTISNSSLNEKEKPTTPTIDKELNISPSPQVDPDVKSIDMHGIKRNKRSIYVQTDGNQDQLSTATTFRPSFKSRLKDETVEAEFSKSKQCLSLEKFVATSKNDFRDYASATRRIFDECVYGELLVFGCNGSPPLHLARQMQSKFVLRKRQKANGVKESFSYVTFPGNPLRPSKQNLTVSYNVSPNRSIVVEYTRDKSTDMFQIGRYEEPPVDFRVVDVTPGHGYRNGVSRFACRIVVQRHGNHEARLYAAAFDSTGNIFLGERALTCIREGKMDGFTTNGVFILHPNRPVWREVSVCGFVYPIRSTDMEPKKRPRLSGETNLLQDGSLIDLCGVTLLWRTPTGLENTPKEECLKKLSSMLCSKAPECQLLKSVQNRTYADGKKQPYVFLCCGHVVRLSENLVQAKGADGWSCPVCRTVGPITQLEVGREPGFFADRDFPSHALRPCGHVTNLKTAHYWSRVKIPEHRSIETGLCPFCGTKLNTIKKYVELLIPQ